MPDEMEVSNEAASHEERVGEQPSPAPAVESEQEVAQQPKNEHPSLQRNDSDESVAAHAEPMAQTEEEEEEKELTVEDILRQEAAKWVQRVVRGHQSRRKALFTPIWMPFPVPFQPFSWGLKDIGFGPTVQDLQGQFDFKERMATVMDVLHNGLGALPHFFTKGFHRPVAKRKARAEFLMELVNFCVQLALAADREGEGASAQFFWAAVDSMTSQPPIPDSSKATKQLDPCSFKGKTLMRILALDHLALLWYRRRDCEQALTSLNSALQICLHKSVGRLPYYILKLHKAIILSGLEQHESALQTLEELVQTLPTVRENPLGDIELLEPKAVYGHLLMVGCFNMGVELSHLNRIEPAMGAIENAMKLSFEGCHPAQPVRRFIANAYSSSLRMAETNARPEGYFACTTNDVNDHPDMGSSSEEWTKLMAPDSTSKMSALEPSSPTSNGPQESADALHWKRWLSVAIKDRAITPIWLDFPDPTVHGPADLGKIMRVPEEGFKDGIEFLAALNAKFPDLEDEEECPPEVLSMVSAELVHQCQKAKLAIKAADDSRAQELLIATEKMLSRDQFYFSNALSWELKLMVHFASANFEFNRKSDIQACRKYVDRAHSLGISNNVDFVKALCKLQEAACLASEGHYQVSFKVAKDALSFCHNLSESALQDPAKRRQLEDVLVGSCQIMGLAHIFLGNGKVALKLSKIASDHLPFSSYRDSESLQYAQVTRIYQVALSMSQLTKISVAFPKHEPVSSSSKKKRQIVDPKLLPSNFVPCALSRHLPELYSTQPQDEAGENSSGYDQLIIPEEVVKAEMSPLNDTQKKMEAQQLNRSGKKYKWRGLYTAETDQQVESYDLPVQVDEEVSELAKTAPVARLKTPYGKMDYTPLNKQRGSDGRPQSRTGSLWADELIYGKEHGKTLYQDPNAGLYFAKVYASAREPSAMIVDPMDSSIRKYVVGDHNRTRLNSRKGRIQSPLPPPGPGNGRTGNLTNWGPDPASDLVAVSREVANRSRTSSGSRKGSRQQHSAVQDEPSLPPRSHTAMGLMRPKEKLEETSVSTLSQHKSSSSLPTTDHTSSISLRERTLPVDGSGSMQEWSEKAENRVDLNETRLLQHMPFHSVVQQSTLPFFSLPRERQSLLAGMESYSQRPVTSYGWGELRKMQRKEQDVRKGRPFYWSHHPEESVYLHSERGLPLKTNKHYRALPYGAQNPAAEQAYGGSSRTANISLGNRSLQKLKMDPQTMTASVELSEASVFSGPRTLSSFY